MTAPSTTSASIQRILDLANRWHTHALFEVERPLAATTFLGEDGLIQTGVGVTLPSLALGQSSIQATFEVTAASNDVLFADANGMTYLGRLQNFFDLGTSYFQIGATASDVIPRRQPTQATGTSASKAPATARLTQPSDCRSAAGVNPGWPRAPAPRPRP